MGTRAFRALGHACIQEKVIKFVLAELLKCLLRERLDTLQVREVERQDRDTVGGVIELEIIIGSLGCLRISRPQDESVRLSLSKELLNQLESLVTRSKDLAKFPGRLTNLDAVR